MSVLIKGMELPTSCYECSLQDDECFGSIKCQYAKTWGSARMRAVDCPLIPVPPHGRLIDADELFPLYADLLDGRDVQLVIPKIVIDTAPTIILPKEKE